MLKRKENIAIGDTVILYTNPSDIKFIRVEKDGVVTNKYGMFAHNDMIDKPFGSKLASKNEKGYLYLLFPTPELWTLVLPHRTQILYNADISLISSILGILPGTHVLESGTGSGSFSHSIARAIAPHGHLFSFEYHPDRSERARTEFKENGVDHLITVIHRDVCKDGFDMNQRVTAVFLDLPSPWEAIDSAVAAFKQDRVGKICCFSPAIEQVQKTCLKLHSAGFTDIRMFEVLSRPYDVRAVPKLPLPKTSTVINTKKRDQQGQEKFENYNAVKVSGVRGHTSFLTFATLLPSMP